MEGGGKGVTMISQRDIGNGKRGAKDGWEWKMETGKRAGSATSRGRV